jgi:HK97 gp10 family phage protein
MGSAGSPVVYMQASGLARKLDAAFERVRRSILSRALLPAAQHIAQRLRANAPVDTGTLRDSVHVVITASGPERYAAKVTIGKGEFQGEAFYAAILEYGSIYIEPQYFARRTVQETEDQVRAMIAGELGRLIRAELRRSA